MKRQEPSLPRKDLRSVMAQAGSALTIIPEHHFDEQPDPIQKPLEGNGSEKSDDLEHPNSDNPSERSNSTTLD